MSELKSKEELVILLETLNTKRGEPSKVAGIVYYIDQLILDRISENETKKRLGKIIGYDES